ncbi:MAG: DUF4194 domain-containing protein [Bacillota bacterium]
MWEAEWSALGDKEQEQFTRVVNLLLQKTFLLRDELDHKTGGNLTINRDYRFLERHLSLFREYLRVSGWELQLDARHGVAALYNRFGYNRRRIDKNTTYFLYVLRLIFEEQMENLSARKEALTTVGAVVEKMFHLGLLEKKPSDKALRDSLSFLKSINIIDRLDGAWTGPETRLVIFPSIIFLVTNDKINSLYELIARAETASAAAGEEEDEEDEAASEDASG